MAEQEALKQNLIFSYKPRYKKVYFIALTGHIFIQFLQKTHSVDNTFCPFSMYFLTSTSIGHTALHFPHLMHLFPVGFILTNEIRVGSFIISETGQKILQKARLFLNTNANIIPIM